jgi:hypothetical protein
VPETLPADGTGWIGSFDPAFNRDPAALSIVGRRHDDSSRLIVGYTQRWLPPRRGLLRRSREADTARIEHVVSEDA